jgi:hypothetical protein
MVGPEYVPLYMLRVPVRYYRQPPAYFRGWGRNAPPRWGQHWGHDWEQRRSGWNRWDRRSAPNPAPLPLYQRQYSGDRYPRQVEQQYQLNQQHYRYQPRDPVVRQRYQEQAVRRTPARQERHDSRVYQDQDPRRSNPRQSGGKQDVERPALPYTSPQQRSPAAQDQKQQSQQGATQREQHTSDSNRKDNPQVKGKGKEASRESKQKRDQEQDSEQDREQKQNR